MKASGNFLWLITFGFLTSVICVFTGIVLCLTLVGIPLGIAHFRIASLALLPFGKNVTTDFESHPKGNIVWLVLGGADTTVTFAVLGGLLCVTIIGIPFAKQFFKLTRLSALPYGAVVDRY